MAPNIHSLAGPAKPSSRPKRTPNKPKRFHSTSSSSDAQSSDAPAHANDGDSDGLVVDVGTIAGIVDSGRAAGKRTIKAPAAAAAPAGKKAGKTYAKKDRFTREAQTLDLSLLPTTSSSSSSTSAAAAAAAGAAQTLVLRPRTTDSGLKGWTGKRDVVVELPREAGEGERVTVSISVTANILKRARPGAAPAAAGTRSDWGGAHVLGGGSGSGSGAGEAHDGEEVEDDEGDEDAHEPPPPPLAKGKGKASRAPWSTSTASSSAAAPAAAAKGPAAKRARTVPDLTDSDDGELVMEPRPPKAQSKTEAAAGGARAKGAGAAKGKGKGKAVVSSDDDDEAVDGPELGGPQADDARERMLKAAEQRLKSSSGRGVQAREGAGKLSRQLDEVNRKAASGKPGEVEKELTAPNAWD